MLPDLDVVETKTDLADLGVSLEGEPALAGELVVLVWLGEDQSQEAGELLNSRLQL